MLYTTKYNFKKTQTEDNSEFEEVLRVTRKMLHDGRKHDGDRSEVMRMVLRNSYVHNSKNITSACMASFLVRNKIFRMNLCGVL